MNITVTKNQVSVNTDYILNDKEYNVNQCYFNFSDEYTDDLVKKAIFVQGTSTIEMSIINNQCQIPAEVLNNGQFELRVYAYEVDGDELVLRYSPSYTTAYVRTGSYIENAESPEVITPTQFEQYMQAMNDGLNEVANVDIDAEQLSNGMSVTITNRYGEDKTVYAYDGEKGEIGATPNIQIGTVVTGDHSAVTRTGTNENPILNFILEKGETGATGNGIATVTKTATSGLVDTYTITYTNGNTTTFNVTNGKGITDISKTSTSGLIDTYTITYNDNTTSTFTVENGNGIANIEKTSTVDNVDTYTITYTNGTTSTFTVTNSTVTDEEFEALQEEVDKYKTLANILPRVSGTGTEISLENTGEDTPLEIDLEGQTSQESTTGKNLLNNTATNRITHGLTITVNEDKTITINGTADANVEFVIASVTLPVGTYIFSGLTNSTTDYAYINFSGIVNIYSGEVERTINTEITTSVRLLLFNGKTYNKLTLYPMIRLASITDGTYEPYTGGIPAPNPDFPFGVKKVTGDNNVKIENANLISTVTRSGNVLLFNGSTQTDYIFKAGTYTLSYVNSNITSVYIKTATTNATSLGSNSPRTFTSNEDFNIWIYRSGMTDNETTNIMLNKGTVAKPYVEHQEQNFPLTLGDLEVYEDGYFFKNETSNPNYDSNLDENAWYLKNYYGKATDNIGSENITINDMKSNGNFYSYCGGTLNNKTITYSKTLIVENTIIYELSAPSFTKVTSQTLISQLNNLKNNAKSYKDVTNITQTNDELPFIITATGFYDLNNLISRVATLEVE